MNQSLAKPVATLHDAPGALVTLGRELTVGVTLALAALPVCMAAGVLVYGQLGHTFLTQAIVSGIYGAVFAGITAALLASSSFIVTTPVASIVIIPAALVGYLSQREQFAAHPQLIIVAVSLCLLVAGILQALFGALNVGRIIKFTPHPVIAGFLNSVAIAIILSQLHAFFKFGAAAGDHWLVVDRPAMLIFVLVLGAVLILFANWQHKVPAPIIGLLAGTTLYYLAKLLFPFLNLGPTIGVVSLAFPPAPPLLELADGATRTAIVSVAPHLLLVSVTIAAVASLQSLLTFRAGQNLFELPPPLPRDLIAQGAGNCAAALAGGLVAVPPPSLMILSYRTGGRTRIAPITCGVSLLLVAFYLSRILAVVPVSVLSAILVSIGYQLFDRWSIGLIWDTMKSDSNRDRRSAWQNLSVVVIVMLVSVLSSIVIGAIAGFALACLIFMIDMSRPIVRRRQSGDEVSSKRWRSADDMTFLRRSGGRRVVLQLQGVLFFGNADDLSRLVDALLPDCDMILFDLRGISDIDVSGATILAASVARCHARGKKVLFCNVPKMHATAAFAKRATAVLSDFDSGLEWMEEETLRTAAEARPCDEPIPFDALDLVKPLDAEERGLLARSLTPHALAAGTVVCAEGEEADRMWIITKGSVSVRLSTASPNDSRRIASMGAGTTVGEMALLESGRRTATVVCDEDMAGYELSRAAFDAILRDHPPLARKLYSYFTREMVQRIRVMHQDLRTSLIGSD